MKPRLGFLEQGGHLESRKNLTGKLLDLELNTGLWSGLPLWRSSETACELGGLGLSLLSVPEQFHLHSGSPT
jgi:hypothetical protein